MNFDGTSHDDRGLRSRVIVNCYECEEQLEVDGSATGITCHGCSSTFVFRACGTCEAISMVPAAMVDNCVNPGAPV